MDVITFSSSDPIHTNPPCAAAWIDDHQAIVARLDTGGRVTTCEIERRGEPEASYLALVVHAIGDRQRIAILGPGGDRLALEREYVSLYRRPDHLIDVEPSGPCTRDDLVDRVRRLAG